MFFKKKRQKKQTVRSFEKTVDVLWNGIHKLDSLIATIVRRHDATVDTAIFVQRSVDDLISTCLIYKEHKLFHLYNEPIINNSIPVMQQLVGQIVNRAKSLFALHNLFEMVRDNAKKTDTEDEEEIVEQISNIESEFHKLFNSIMEEYVSLREFIIMIRTIVSRDKMAILCGVDLYLLYEHNEKLVEKSISRTIRIDQSELDKQIKEKVGAENE